MPTTIERVWQVAPLTGYSPSATHRILDDDLTIDQR
jgi:hypothetical protein